MTEHFMHAGREKRTQMNRSAFVRLLFVCSVSQLLVVPTFANDLDTLIQSSCIDCHDSNTEARLDFTKLDRDFEDANTFRAWVKIVDRIRKGEMPPASEPRPDAQTQTAALTFLKKKLFEVNRRQQQEHGRVPSRRLSRLEY